MNEPLHAAPLQRRTDQFLERVRRTGEHSMAAIAEAVAESTRRIGRPPDDPVAEMAEAMLGPLRVIEQEARRAITRVEAITEEWQRHGREQIVIGPDSDERGELLRSRRDPIASAHRVSGHRPQPPQPARGEDRP